MQLCRTNSWGCLGCPCLAMYLGEAHNKRRFRKKRYAIITVVRDQYSVGVPYALADGQEAHWGIPLHKPKSWIDELCDGFVRTPEDAMTLLFRVHTSHGEHLSLEPEESFRKAVLEALERKGG